MTNSEKTQHLSALEVALSNERARMMNAKTDSERALRKVWVGQLEREISFERGYFSDIEISDDELLAELGIN
jgi:hypothetical protein